MLTGNDPRLAFATLGARVAARFLRQLAGADGIVHGAVAELARTGEIPAAEAQGYLDELARLGVLEVLEDSVRVVPRAAARGGRRA